MHTVPATRPHLGLTSSIGPEHSVHLFVTLLTWQQRKPRPLAT